MAKKKSSVQKSSSVKKKSNVKKKSVARKKPTIKRVYVRSSPSHGLDDKTKNLLVENFVGLQKVVVELTTRMDSLVANMAKLLSLFESSAESLVKKNFEIDEVKKKKPMIKEENSRQIFSPEREKSFGSNNLLSQPNKIPEFQRMPSNNQNSSYPEPFQNFQNNPMNYGSNFQNGNPEFSQGQNNFGSSMNSGNQMNSFGNNPEGINNFEQKNIENTSEGLPILPNSSSGGEIPGSGEGA